MLGNGDASQLSDTCTLHTSMQCMHLSADIERRRSKADLMLEAGTYAKRAVHLATHVYKARGVP